MAVVPDYGHTPDPTKESNVRGGEIALHYRAFVIPDGLKKKLESLDGEHEGQRTKAFRCRKALCREENPAEP